MAEWTADQRKVLEAKKRNVLVSAAAGSGKTTVLIERIMRMISEGEQPVDVDRLLIVTFTDAAAGEMRARLRTALLKKIEADPGNARLNRQLLLLPRAHVSTIHSFCTWLLRNYFHVIDLEPGFRVADGEETELLKSDVMQELLEEEYQKGEESFLDFTEIVSSKKDDEGVAPLIRRLYDFSRSAPYPEEWLRDCLQPYRIDSEEALAETRWFQMFAARRRDQLGEILRGYERLLEKCREEGGPAFCISDFTEEAEAIRFAARAEGWKELKARMNQVVFRRKKNPPKGFQVDKEKNAAAGELRTKLKKEFEKLGKTLPESGEEILTELRAVEPEVRELCRLTAAFSEAYSRAKRKKNLVDFGDLEHFAIRILRNPDHSRTEVARMLSAEFAEIMIDEYQDSNLVQEEILTAVSGLEEGRNNMFMVGDMKQSIYRFRMARPELFMEKYRRFTSEDGPSQKIELHANFRSRREVVDSVNFFFRRIMHRELGGIEYDGAAALQAGAHYEDAEGADYRTELFLIEPGGERDSEAAAEAAELPETEEERPENKELELRAVAREILRLTDPETGLLLQERSRDGAVFFRRAEYRDIVLLSRSLTGYETLAPEIFLSYGIPVYAKSRTGYFSAWEVELVLNLLRVVDNPIQDIPLAAVLRSPLFGFTAAEMAQIRLPYHPREEGNGFYGALRLFASSDGDGREALRERVRAFLKKTELYREKARSLTVSELLRFLLSDLELELYVAAMKGGAQREDNLLALLEKAESYENSSYHGLYHFIRYIEKLKKTSIDEGETNSLSERDNVVRLMTTHSSKGLEFPMVFVIGLGKRINTQDERGIAVIHPDYGIGMKLIDLQSRVKKSTLIHEAFRDCLHAEALGEELRILYVAMTRAEQKLYLTGVCPRSFDPAAQEQWEAPEEDLGGAELFGAKSYLDWILGAYRTRGPVKLRLLPAAGLLSGDGGAEAGEPVRCPALLSELPAEPGEELRPVMARLREVLAFPYLYDELRLVRSTLSVSLLKEMSRKLREDREHYDEAEVNALVDDIPERGKQRDARKAAAAYGTLVHLIFEKIIPGEAAASALRRLLAAGLIDEEQAASVNPGIFDTFYASELGKRCTEAFGRKKLYRERRFIIGLPVKELLPDLQVRNAEEELLMLQGTTDLYFEEEDGLVLADYKTDRVKCGEELTERYALQLSLYEKALVQSTGKRVKEKWIWSVALGRAVQV